MLFTFSPFVVNGNAFKMQQGHKECPGWQHNNYPIVFLCVRVWIN